MVIEKITLRGYGVRLEPLDPDSHFDGLTDAIADGELWRIPVTSVPHPDDLDRFFADAEDGFAAGRELAFATIDEASGRIAGSTRFRAIDEPHRRVEIGFTFLAAGFQRTVVNTAAKLLMMRHAFDVWGANRVEYLTDVLNERSRTAIERIGAEPEGVLRHHMVMRDGRIRDSAIYSVISTDWPRVQEALEGRLGVNHEREPDD